MSQKYNLYTILFEESHAPTTNESFSDTMHIMPGTPEWDDLQKVLAMANMAKASSEEVVKDEPSLEGDYPTRMSRQQAIHFTPEEADILRKAAGIMRSKG